MTRFLRRHDNKQSFPVDKVGVEASELGKAIENDAARAGEMVKGHVDPFSQGDSSDRHNMARMEKGMADIRRRAQRILGTYDKKLCAVCMKHPHHGNSDFTCNDCFTKLLPTSKLKGQYHVRNYMAKAGNGAKIGIRTMVITPTGEVIRFTERLSKKEAIRQVKIKAHNAVVRPDALAKAREANEALMKDLQRLGADTRESKIYLYAIEKPEKELTPVEREVVREMERRMSSFQYNKGDNELINRIGRNIKQVKTQAQNISLPIASTSHRRQNASACYQ